MKILASLVVAFICSSLFGANINIKFEDVKSKQGQMIVYVYNNEDGFPTKPEKAYKTIFVPIDDKLHADTVVVDLPSATYAIGVIHDENKSNKVDTNFIGIPKEGYGASNNPKGFMGPPSFEDASFSLDENDINLLIKVKY